MKYKHFIIIRFSLRLERKNWKHNIEDWDLERLNNRFFLFENITLPSLTNQTKKDNVHVIIMITSDLPSPYLERLNQLIKPHKNYIHTEIIKDNEFRNTEFIRKYFDKDTEKVATTRLDDDDALNPLFNEKISNYIESIDKDNYIISFRFGYWLNLDRLTQSVTYLKAKKRLIACGLTKVSNVDITETVYCGNHNSWRRRKFYIIDDDSSSMYLVANHRFNDSNGRLSVFKRMDGNKPLDKDIYDSFPYLKERNLDTDPITDLSSNSDSCRSDRRYCSKYISNSYTVDRYKLILQAREYAKSKENNNCNEEMNKSNRVNSNTKDGPSKADLILEARENAKLTKKELAKKRKRSYRKK